MSVSTPTAPPVRFPWAAMSALGLAVFACVSSEFLPTGMLPEMSADLDVPQSSIGFLVTVWAFTVVILATPLSLLTRRFSRKGILVAAVVLFAISNVIAAVSVNYAMLFGSRIVGGVSNALFWMVAMAYVSHLLPSELHSRGFLFVSGGANLAFIVGLPLSSFIAHSMNWRIGFMVMAAATLLAGALLWVFLAPVDHDYDDAHPDATAPWRDRSFGPVMIVVGITFLVVAAHNVFYPFIKPFLLDRAAFSADEASGVLALYGIGGVAGIFVAWWLGRNPAHLVRNLIAAIIFLGIAMLAVRFAAPEPVIVIAATMAWSAAFSIADPLYGQLMMTTASARIRDFASALRTTAWNLGIGTGAFLGSLALVPWGVGALPYMGAALAVLGAALAIVPLVRARRVSR